MRSHNSSASTERRSNSSARSTTRIASPWFRSEWFSSVVASTISVPSSDLPHESLIISLPLARSATAPDRETIPHHDEPWARFACCYCIAIGATESASGCTRLSIPTRWIVPSKRAGIVRSWSAGGIYAAWPTVRAVRLRTYRGSKLAGRCRMVAATRSQRFRWSARVRVQGLRAWIGARERVAREAPPTSWRSPPKQ